MTSETEEIEEMAEHAYSSFEEAKEEMDLLQHWAGRDPERAREKARDLTTQLRDTIVFLDYLQEVDPDD